MDNITHTITIASSDPEVEVRVCDNHLADYMFGEGDRVTVTNVDDICEMCEMDAEVDAG
jgi:hypothetical protein